MPKVDPYPEPVALTAIDLKRLTVMHGEKGRDARSHFMPSTRLGWGVSTIRWKRLAIRQSAWTSQPVRPQHAPRVSRNTVRSGSTLKMGSRRSPGFMT